MSVLKIKNGNTWEKIPAGGVGVPSGGSSGNALVKASATDYATIWKALTVADLGVEIDFGVTEQLNIANANYTDIPITFHKTFSAVPYVFATPISDSTAYQFGSMQLTIKYASGAPVISTTGVTFRWFNNSGVLRNPFIMWMAILIP